MHTSLVERTVGFIPSNGEPVVLFMTYDRQPALRCAVCDKPILTAPDAVVVYPRDILPGQLFRVCIAHPGACEEAAQGNLENESGPGLCMTLVEYGDRFRGAAGSREQAYST